MDQPKHIYDAIDERYLVNTLVRLTKIPTDVPLGPETLIEPDHPKLVHYVQDVIRSELQEIGVYEIMDAPMNQLVVRMGMGTSDRALLIMAYTPTQHANLMKDPFSGKIAVPRQVLLAEVRGKPVGFSVTLPDVNEAIRPLGGRLTTFGLPVGLARLLYRLPRVKTARMAVLVLLEGYRRRGISELLILETLDYGKNVIGYHGAELSWTLEDNELINRTIERVGGVRYKTYRIYQKPID